MEKALEFFQQAIGRPASQAEQTGDIGLPILLALIDARFTGGVEKVKAHAAEEYAEARAREAAQQDAAQKSASGSALSDTEPPNDAAAPEAASA
jgi:hypothetical protein